MRPDDFFIDEDLIDPFSLAQPGFNQELMTDIRRGPLAEHDDVEVAVALARLVHDDLTTYGTGGSPQLTEEDMRLALRALRTVTGRIGLDFESPFRDFSSFHSWWMNNGAYNSYSARRALLSGIFDPIHDRLAVLEDQSLASSLADPISSHDRTGWSGVDTEIGELRRHFASARTPQDYRNVGHDSVSVTEALSRHLYDPEKHLHEGEVEPPVGNTKDRLERFVEDSASGPDNASLRKFARDVIAYAQHVKHSETPSRREAGIAADAVILLANILRRLDEPNRTKEYTSNSCRPVRPSRLSREREGPEPETARKRRARRGATGQGGREKADRRRHREAGGLPRRGAGGRSSRMKPANTATRKEVKTHPRRVNRLKMARPIRPHLFDASKAQYQTDAS